MNLQIQSDQDKSKLIKEVRVQCENEKQRAIEITRKETKKTTWCSNCPKEARFYCCWNTSYCGQQCQKTHWQSHQKYCTNVSQNYKSYNNKFDILLSKTQKNSTTENQHQQQQQQQHIAVQISQLQAQVNIEQQQIMPGPVSRVQLRSPQHLQQQVIDQEKISIIF